MYVQNSVIPQKFSAYKVLNMARVLGMRFSEEIMEGREKKAKQGIGKGVCVGGVN